MNFKVICRTQFDITATGVRSNFNQNRVPFVDDAGQKIQDQSDWHRSRNQQRNWETINQLISLRTLPIHITRPQMFEKSGCKSWQFEFSVENIGQIELEGDALGALKKDCHGVPMILGLDETYKNESFLILDTNISFLLESD